MTTAPAQALALDFAIRRVAKKSLPAGSQSLAAARSGGMLESLTALQIRRECACIIKEAKLLPSASIAACTGNAGGWSMNLSGPPLARTSWFRCGVAHTKGAIAHRMIDFSPSHYLHAPEGFFRREACSVQGLQGARCELS